MRSKMESAFGADFSAVKLYESQSVADAGAEAVTQGSSIAFAPGKLDLASSGGQSLLGHELSHVVSQQRGEVTGSGFLNDHALEARADREGAMAAAGQQVYAGPVTGAMSSAAPAVSAAAPMQARRAKSRQEMLSNDFDVNAGAKTVRRNPSEEEGFTGLNAMAFGKVYGTQEERTTSYHAPEENIRGTERVLDEDDNVVTKQRFSEAEGATVEADSFDNATNNNNIKGNIYRPAKSNGKHVIVYSGSGGTNQDQMGGAINKYLKEGYTVYAYDYGGFGQSTTPDNKLSEKSMQQDAQAMLEHVNGMNVANENLILHGLSMGGNMASHVARNAAIKAEKSGRKEDKLSSLVLESAMKSTSHAGGILGPLASPQGEFDTQANLQELSRLDPDMPINLIGGGKDDGLGLASTKLDKYAGKRFKNVKTHTSAQAEHLDQNKLSNAWDTIKDNLHRRAPAPQPDGGTGDDLNQGVIYHRPKRKKKKH